MEKSLREAWQREIQPEDYDAHMAAVGQAQANAQLVTELFARRPPASGSQILFAGAGTGHMFDFASPTLLTPYRTTFTDINFEFLKRLSSRLKSVADLWFETQVDDVENSHLPGGFELSLAVLVLEHVDWHAAIGTLARLTTSRVFVIIQENPPHLAASVTRTFPRSMAVLHDIKRGLLAKSEVQREFRHNGFELGSMTVREVLDAKRMVGLEFERT